VIEGYQRLQERLAKYYTLWCNIAMDQLTDVLTAISHPTRRAIIGQLANGPARFLDVAKPFDTALNAVTKHLKLLERAGLIERKKQGREVYISFRGEPLRKVAGWMHEYERFWNEHLDQFERYFRAKKKEEKRTGASPQVTTNDPRGRVKGPRHSRDFTK
jgi:DNA-binding transcriptional ArsR family regulator